jgi:hypothetical protein
MNRIYRPTTALSVILFIYFALQSCSDKSNTGSGVKDCVITNKARLEDIQIFPSDNPINTSIYDSPVDPHSEAILALIGTPSLHADFGSGLYDGLPMGIPFILVCQDQRAVPIVFREDGYGDQSDPGPYPVPLTAPMEGNGTGDSHVLCVDIDNEILYELYDAAPGASSWQASSGAVWDLKVNSTRTPGWTSADAAGMPILPLLVRYDEVISGSIDHAIRFTLDRSLITRAYTSPASHLISGSNSDPSAPIPMGMRIRLKKDFDISGFSATNQVILSAMKNYGLILADAGSSMFFSGAPDDRWDNDDLHALTGITAAAFEVVQMGSIVTK